MKNRAEIRWIPSEIKYRFRIGWHSILGPGQKVELSNSSGFASLQIFQIETTNEIIIAPNMFRNEMYFISVIDFTAFFRPISVTHRNSVLHQSSQHYDYDTSLFPNHLIWWNGPKIVPIIGQSKRETKLIRPMVVQL